MTAHTFVDLDKLRVAAAGLILCLAAVAIIVNIALPERAVPNLVSVLAIAVAGYLFAPVITNRRNGNGGKK